MASVADKAQLSAAVYGDYKAPANWEPCCSPGIDEDTGFFAQAYRNRDTGEIVITFRGTDNQGGRNSDLQLVQGQIPDQFKQAMQYFRGVCEKYPGAVIELTGHSLGGMLAQMVKLEALRLDPTDRTRVDAFDSPGLLFWPNWDSATGVLGRYGSQLREYGYLRDSENNYLFGQQQPTKCPSELGIVNHIRMSSLIDLLGGHIGEIDRIWIPAPMKTWDRLFPQGLDTKVITTLRELGPGWLIDFIWEEIKGQHSAIQTAEYYKWLEQRQKVSNTVADPPPFFPEISMITPPWTMLQQTSIPMAGALALAAAEQSVVFQNESNDDLTGTIDFELAMDDRSYKTVV